MAQVFLPLRTSRVTDPFVLSASYAMTMRFCILAAALPPALNGIGDYTAKFAEHLARNHIVIITTPQKRTTALKGVEVHQLPDLGWRGLRQLKQVVTDFSCDWLVLQYNPFSYGRWGLAPLLARYVEATREVSGCGIAVMVHESYVQPRFFRDAVYSTWQRWQLRKLVVISNVAFASIEAWALKIRELHPSSEAIHLPVASNIERLSISAEEARVGLGIGEREFVMTIYGRVHPTKDFALAKAAIAAVAKNRPVTSQYIGPDSDAVRRVLSGAGATLVTSGVAPPDEISRRLAATDLALFPFTDGISTRRTTLMSALQHGLPVLGTVGPLTDGVLRAAADRAFWLTPVGDAQTYAVAAATLASSPRLRGELGASAQSLYAQQFDWPILIARFLAGLASSGRRASARTSNAI